MADLLLIWLLLLAALTWLAVTRRQPGGALTLAYFLGLSIIHVPGVLAYIGPISLFIGRAPATRIGFELTLMGMATFVGGAIVGRQFYGRIASKKSMPSPEQGNAFIDMGLRALGIGFVCYFVVLPIAAKVPSLSAVVSPIGTLVVLGFWLRLHGAALANAQSRTLATLALLPILPLSTLATSGFLGYGINWLLSVITFLFVITRRRLIFYVSAPLVIYLGLSFFVTYMSERKDIRELVWYEDAGMMERLDRISGLVTNFQLLDLEEPAQLVRLDDRLNQNFLVGAGVMHHEAGMVDLAYGGTVPVWALIPRALWPDKPVVGGGLDVVSAFTGLRFGKNTSVGAGQVLEFYINFGKPGVLIGFAMLGFALMWLDCKIMSAFAEANMRRLIICAMPGLVLLQPGGNLLEISVSLIAATIISRLIAATQFFRLPSRAVAMSSGGARPRGVRVIRRQ